MKKGEEGLSGVRNSSGKAPGCQDHRREGNGSVSAVEGMMGDL